MASKPAAEAKPFIEHVYELRRRLMLGVAAILLGSAVGYAISGFLFDVLKQPLNQTLYYTTPAGAFTFVMKLCLVFGIIVSLPVILYQIIGFLRPLMRSATRRYIATVLICSLLLAAGGIASAYFVSLPNALHFLTSFHTADVQSLITVNEYFNFVLAYLAGSALLFQLPLIMSVINRVKPLQPRKLMGYERHVILGSFIIGAILTPTPDPMNQALMSVPIIVAYQVGVIIVWISNFKRDSRKSEKQLMTSPLVAQPKTPVTLPSPALQVNAITRPTPAVPRPRLIHDVIRQPIQRYGSSL